MPLEIVQRAADKAGGLAVLARALGIKHTSFYRWKAVPADRVLQIEEITGIPRYEIRPDIYPSPDRQEQINIESELRAMIRRYTTRLTSQQIRAALRTAINEVRDLP